MRASYWDCLLKNSEADRTRPDACRGWPVEVARRSRPDGALQGDDGVMSASPAWPAVITWHWCWCRAMAWIDEVQDVLRHRWPEVVAKSLEQEEPAVAMCPAMLPISDGATEVRSLCGLWLCRSTIGNRSPHPSFSRCRFLCEGTWTVGAADRFNVAVTSRRQRSCRSWRNRHLRRAYHRHRSVAAPSDPFRNPPRLDPLKVGFQPWS
jgi:hypothetical protein